MAKDDDVLVSELEDPTDQEIPFRFSITSFGADYTAELLFNKLKNGDIFIPPFQRNYVWEKKQASKFIESLLLGLPIPGVFLSREQDSGKYLVIDGLQRLKSIEAFYEGVFPKSEKVFSLVDVQKEWDGKTYKTLTEKDRRQLDNSIIHATIVKQDQPSNDNSSVYLIFERLNSGGTQLTPQEIRACIYHGQFNELIRTLNENHSWRNIFGVTSPRMRDQELILRFLALNNLTKPYKSPMKTFLNEFMGDHKKMTAAKEKEFHDQFFSTIDLIEKVIGPKSFRRETAINAAVFDSVMVGVSKRILSGPISDLSALKNVYDGLLANDDFINATESGTSKEEKVKLRLELAIDGFSKIK
jgi:uncharacterized protein with ParB-like and HNH nuclease domain